MQLIDRSYSGSSYSQRTFPFGSSASDDHENTNETTELCSLSEFARKLHAKTQDDLSQLPGDIQEQFVPTPQPEYVTHLTVSGMSELKKSHTRQQLTKAIDFLMEQEFLISRKINEQARGKKEKNQEFSIDQELDNLLLLLEEHRDLVKRGVQRETDEYMRFQKSKKLRCEEEDQLSKMQEQNDPSGRKQIETISEESYFSNHIQEQMRNNCFQYLLSHCKYEGNAGDNGENIISFKWKLTHEEKQQVQQHQLKDEILNADGIRFESKEYLPQNQKKERADYGESIRLQDLGNYSNNQKKNHGAQQIHTEIDKIEFTRKEADNEVKQEEDEDPMQQLFRSIMEADSLDDLHEKTTLQHRVNANQINDSHDQKSYLSTSLVVHQENHNSRTVSTTGDNEQISSPMEMIQKVKNQSKDKENVLKAISINALEQMKHKDKPTKEEMNQKGFGNMKLFNHRTTIPQQENKIPSKLQMNLSSKLISDTWKPKGIIGHQSVNCIRELRD